MTPERIGLQIRPDLSGSDARRIRSCRARFVSSPSCSPPRSETACHPSRHSGPRTWGRPPDVVNGCCGSPTSVRATSSTTWAAERAGSSSQRHGNSARGGGGFDIDPARIADAELNAMRAGVEKLVTFRLQDAVETDVSEATVVTLYIDLGPQRPSPADPHDASSPGRPHRLAQLRHGCLGA